MGCWNGEVVVIVVEGLLPPAKGEARSMLSAGHPHRGRVTALLQAARDALGNRPPTLSPVSLTVSVWAVGPTSRVSDATNLLGGIGDVLQLRSTGADVEHLGELAIVGCFQDDAQIVEISYRLHPGQTDRYEVRIAEVS